MSGTGAVLDAQARMDEIYRYQRFIYDASRRWFLFGRDRLLADLDPPRGGTILEIGCGTGRNLIRAAALYPDVRLYGLDLSKVMLETARHGIAKSGLNARIALAEADATSFDPKTLFGCADFDRIVLSYTLSMIPPWQEALRAALGRIAPGGRLHVVDFGQQQGHPAWARDALRLWLSRFSVTPRDDLAAILEAEAQTGFTLRVVEGAGGYYVYAIASRARPRGLSDGHRS